MISERMVSYLDSLPLFGCQHLLRGYERDEGRFNIRQRFRDLTDEDLKKVLSIKHRNVIDVIDAVSIGKDDETKAHLAGFPSDKDYQTWIKHVLNGVRHGQTI